jgi:hypothetical protein
VSDSFPYEWIKKKWREGFFVTAMATANTQWAVIMSRTQGIISQVSKHCAGADHIQTHTNRTSFVNLRL